MGKVERIDFAQIRVVAASRQIQDVGRLSLGQWSAICDAIAKGGNNKVEPPSDEQFEMIMNQRA